MIESESAGEAEVEARLRAASARTRQDLSEEDLATLRQKIGQYVKQRQAMRAVPLHNHDEPEHGFDPAATRSGQEGVGR